jgi:hypothetical protein
MKPILKTGAVLLMLSVVLIALSALFMRAHAGNVVVASENRDIDAQVVNLVISGSTDIVLKQSSTAALTIKGESTMLPRVTTRTEGNTLYIGTRGLIITTRQPLIVELQLPNLEKLQIMGSGDASVRGFRGVNLLLLSRGSGDLNFEGEYQQVKASSEGSGDMKLVMLNNDRLDIALQGSGDALVKGQTKALNVRLLGTGDIDASNLKAIHASVDSSGSADARVFSSGEISVKLRGSGDISVFGNPAKRQVDRSGSGEVHWQ